MTSSPITNAPSSFECYTCEQNFISSSLPFTLYQCKTCNEKTPFCANCLPIITKLFGPVVFKCQFCNSIDKAITKEEIIRQSQNCNSLYSLPSLKTPLKSSLTPNTISPLFITEEQKSNFNDDFSNKLCITSSNNTCIEPQMTPLSGNEAFINKYTLLSRKKQGTQSVMKKMMLSNSCCNNSGENCNNVCDSEFAGYNKKMKRAQMLTKSKYIVQSCNKSLIENGINLSNCSINNSNSLINGDNGCGNSDVKSMVSPFSSSALQKLSFSSNVDEFGNRKNVAGFGMRCQLGGSFNNGNIDTPHKFNINLNLTPSSFQINPI